jgi:uncharacterized membrane protein (UPF0136 family)
MASAVALAAQERTYDEDALRIDNGLRGLRIVRGASDSIVLRVGIVRSVDVSRLVSTSPNAVAQAKVFEANYRQGIWTAVLGVAIWPAVFAINHIGTNQPVPLGITFTTVALVTYGAIRIDNAKRALSKAVWWYNRDLKR